MGEVEDCNFQPPFGVLYKRHRFILVDVENKVNIEAKAYLHFSQNDYLAE